MSTGLKRHYSTVMEREIVVANHKSPLLARKFMSGISDDDIVFIQREIDIMKCLDNETIKSIGQVKEIFKNAELINFSA